jgi:hypothetical protein
MCSVPRKLVPSIAAMPMPVMVLCLADVSGELLVSCSCFECCSAEVMFAFSRELKLIAYQLDTTILMYA